MTHPALLLTLLAGACLSLMGLGFSAILVSRAQKARERRTERLAAIVSPHAKRVRIEASAFMPATDKQQTSLRGTVTLVFGFDPEKTTMYPVNGWIVILVSLVAGKLLQMVAGYLVPDWLALASIPLAWVFFSRSFFSWAQQRHQSALLMQFPDALAMLVRSVRVGIPVLEAIRAVAREAPSPTGPGFARLIDQISIGVPLEDAVQELARRGGIPEYRFFATALSLQTQTGGTLSETLEGLADVIRKRIALKGRGKALTAEARTSALILAVLPVAVGGMLYIINPTYMMLLFTDPMGHTILGMAILSLALGLGIIRALIRRALS
jgi:tight adherence protein B